MNQNNFAIIDPATCPLSGISLIEASAGTGKTYTIQNLFLRLIAEKALPIQSILVMTFTNAATQELQDRIRQILHNAQLFLTKPELLKEDESKRIKELLQNAMLENQDPEIILARIKIALLDFDAASIFTIHSFCQKILREFAFESGILFNTDTCKDTKEIIRRLKKDCIRKYFYQKIPGINFAELIKEFMNDKRVDQLIKDLIARDKLVVLSSPEANVTPEVLKQTIDELKELYSPGLLASYTATLQKKQEDYMQKRDKQLTEWKETGNTPFELIQLLTELRKENIEKITDKRKTKIKQWQEYLSQPFFQKCGELYKQHLLFTQSITIQIAQEVKQKFAELKQQKNIQTFDDMPQKVRDAVISSESLTRLIRKKYFAAIVDEFQDTDPIQYKIVMDVFANRQDPLLFMVGDPKQAIYAFRGGDIATYRRASLDCAAKNGYFYFLDTNYRSADNLIKAINTLFDRHPYPFADKNIGFHPVKTGLLKKDGNPVPGWMNQNQIEDPVPLKMHMLKMEKNSTKAVINKWSAAACAENIRNMLQNRDGYFIKDKFHVCTPADFAILVTTHYEVSSIKTELNKRNIPSVVAKSGNVFKSTASVELFAVLRAVCDPTSRDKIINAMITRMMGYSVHDLIQMQDDADKGQLLDGVPEFFRSLQTVWKNTSFIKMLQLLMQKYSVRERLLSGVGGERILTDLLHLRELLHTAEITGELTPDAVITYLQKMMQEDQEESEEHEAIMETDSEAVVITTIHASKGLEYPIVMLPTLYNLQCIDKPGNFHDQQDRLIRDMTGNENLLNVAKLEYMQERMRLLYVAVTRAKYQCHIFWGNLDKRNQPCVMDWIFKIPPLQGETVEPLTLLDILNDADVPKQIPPEWEFLYSGDNVSCTPWIPERKSQEEFRERPHWRRKLNQDYQFSSFSQLAGYISLETTEKTEAVFDENEDSDNDDALNIKTELPPIFTFKSGVATGNAWHEILEETGKVDPESPEFSKLVENKLQKFGLLSGQTGIQQQESCTLTIEMVKNVLQAKLTQHPGAEFTLADIPRGNQLHELEFCRNFRNKFQVRELTSLVATYCREKFGESSLSKFHVDNMKLTGFLSGFIDLLFCYDGKYYIVDWKSNRLDGNPENFNRTGMIQEMISESYPLQYILYTSAFMQFLELHLDRKITEEDFDRYFGGVYYFFLRGISPQFPERGIFYDRPSFRLIQKINTIFG